MTAKWFQTSSGFDVSDLQNERVIEVAFTSAWLSHAQWDPQTERCNVTFKDGFTWVGSMDDNLFNSLATAASPGGWWHANMMTTAAGSRKVGRGRR